MDELLAEFLTETQESLGDLNQALLALEQVPDDLTIVGKVFRLMHTIKGTCGFLALTRLEALSHAAEDLLGRMRDQSLQPGPAVVTLVLAAVDAIKVILNAIAATGHEPPGEDAALIAALLSAQGDVALAGAPDGVPDGVPDGAMAGTMAGAMAGAIAGTMAGTMAGAMVGTMVDGEPLAPPDAKASLPADPMAPHLPGPGQPQTIRVNVDVIEGLMTMVSEMVLTRNQLLQIARTNADNRFSAALQRLSNLTTSLQEGVMRTRMQPIEQAWNRLPRMIRDLSIELGKPIALHLEGGGTELDRQVLELIRDPLTHMVRNSADHGLETPAARRAAGKPETGTISLRAFHEGGHIVVQIADDGAGLPLASIQARAVAQGLATEAEIAAMTEQQVVGFVFQPGFSTAARVTAVSGRGVGLDVVRSNIERIGGTVELRSRAGQGVTFTIKIPLTLAIISALIVEVQGERFALPQSAVVELVRTQASGTPLPASARGEARPEGAGSRAGSGAESGAESGAKFGTEYGAEHAPCIERVNGTMVLRLRDRLQPLVELASLLDLGDSSGHGTAGGEGDGQRTVVVTTVGNATLGLAVDRVYDVEEIVAKPLAPILRHIALFSGNTILGDGSVIMILDPAGVARAAGVAAAAERVAVRHEAPPCLGTRELSSLLLFRQTAGGAPSCVPLGLVARIEDVDPAKIETTSGRLLMEYRGQLMPLIDLDPGRLPAPPEARVPVLVFVDRQRRMGLIVHEILDVVEERVTIEVSATRPGLLGTALLLGRVTEVMDASHWLMQAWHDWFQDGRRWDSPPRLLVVEDNTFFLHVLVPSLSSAGYLVTAVESAAAALALRDMPQTPNFDAIISDIEMPEMDGLGFVRALRSGGRWSDVPVIALSGRSGPVDIRNSQAAGFTDHVGKFERDRLLNSLRLHLGGSGLDQAAA